MNRDYADRDEDARRDAIDERRERFAGCKCGNPDMPGQCPGWRNCPMHGEPGGVCDGCGEDIAPEFLEAATNVPPDYMPEDFRKRATTVLCELCRTEGDE